MRVLGQSLQQRQHPGGTPSQRRGRTVGQRVDVPGGDLEQVEAEREVVQAGSDTRAPPGAFGTERRNVSSWRCGGRARRAGRSGRRSGGRRSRPGPRGRSAPSPRAAGRPSPMPMFQRPQSPCQPPRRHALGAVAALDRVDRGLQAGAVRGVGEQLRRAAGAATRSRSRPGARSCVPARRDHLAHRGEPGGPGHPVSRVGRQRRHHEDLEPGPASVVEQPRHPEGAGVGGRRPSPARPPRGGRARPSGRCGPPWRSPAAVPSRSEDLQHRLLVDPAGAEHDADPDRRCRSSPRGGSRSSRRPGPSRARAASATGPGRTRGSGPSAPAGRGPGRRARNGRCRAAGAWSTSRARPPGPAAAGAARSGTGRRRGAAGRGGAGRG